MTDIVKRLRDMARSKHRDLTVPEEAAYEIERLRKLVVMHGDDADATTLRALRAERDRLRAGLMRVIQYENKCDQTGQPCDASRGCACSLEAETWCDGGRP
jgi:hypothetical protein